MKVFEIAPTVGCLNIPEGALVSLAEVDKLKDNKVVILCTGTQGEPMAALSRIAKNMHKHIKVKEGIQSLFRRLPFPEMKRRLPATSTIYYDLMLKLCLKNCRDSCFRTWKQRRTKVDVKFN